MIGAALFWLAGCEEYSVKGNLADEALFLDSGGATEPDTATTDGAPVPGWFALSASLPVEGGAAGAGVGTVRVEVVDTAGEEVLCGADLQAGWEGTTGAEEVPLWWGLTVEVGDLCAALPPIRLGIGALLPDARARLGAVGLATDAPVYGAYVAAGAGAEIYGYAARPEDLEGSGEAVLPLPDGVYALAPLYLIPL